MLLYYIFILNNSQYRNKINVNAQAWNLVKAEPIVNCWRKTGISPTVNENGDDSIHYPTSSNCTGNGKSRESRGH